MSEIKYEIIKKIGVLSKSALALSAAEGSGWRLGKGSQPDQLERQRAEIRHPRLVRRWGEDGQRCNPVQRRVAVLKRVTE